MRSLDSAVVLPKSKDCGGGTLRCVGYRAHSPRMTIEPAQVLATIRPDYDCAIFGGGGYELQDTFSVPSNKVGLVMGKGGETIKSICAQSGAHCQVDKTAPEGAREKNIVIKGTPDAIETAKQLIAEKIGGGGPGGYGSNGGHFQPEPQYGQYEPPQSGYQPAPAPSAVPVNPSTGQPDYSSQWADYYRSMGMLKEA